MACVLSACVYKNGEQHWLDVKNKTKQKNHNQGKGTKTTTCETDIWTDICEEASFLSSVNTKVQLCGEDTFTLLNLLLVREGIPL